MDRSESSHLILKKIYMDSGKMCMNSYFYYHREKVYGKIYAYIAKGFF